METSSERLAGAPVLFTADAVLETEVRRLAAAAGTGIDRQQDPAVLGHAWNSASVVLIGADIVPAVAARHPVRRRDVHVLAPGAATPEVFRDALAVGAESVTELPDGNGWLVELLTDVDDGASRPAVVLGVIGTSGGVGASTLAAALAAEAGRHGDCLLVDADPHGCGVEQIVAMPQMRGVRWSGIGSTGRLGGRALRESLPRRGPLAVLGFDPGPVALPSPEVVRETISAARRGFEVVVVDLGRQPDPAVDVVLAQCERTFVVTTLTLPALAAGSRLRHRVSAGAGLVARGAERGVDATSAAGVLDLPLAAAMRDQAGLDEAIMLGLAPTHRRHGPLARAAAALLATLPGRQP